MFNAQINIVLQLENIRHTKNIFEHYATKNSIKNQFLKWQLKDFQYRAKRYILWGHVPIFVMNSTEGNTFNIKTERTQQRNEQMSIHRHWAAVML